MILLQINTTLNAGSHGRIAENIGLLALQEGHSSHYAASYVSNSSSSKIIQIGNGFDRIAHVLITRIFDRHGFGSRKATQRLIAQIEKIRPDIIHLHNVHGYYLNIKILFDYLRKAEIPIVWTLHDCWPFTGHCSHFDAVNCHKWENECNRCPNLNGYPKSLFFDNSKRNYIQKRELFSSVRKMVLVSPSIWLSKHIKKSYLRDYESLVINNGIDLNIFKPQNSSTIHKYYQNKRYILGVANTWNNRKAFLDFILLRKVLHPDIEIILVGISKNLQKSIPPGIIGIPRTENIEDLASLYSGAEAFVNPTYVDNFPTTNLESLACGTPVITYDTGGSPETIDCKTGYVVPKGDIEKLASVIDEVIDNGKQKYLLDCRSRAVNLYDKSARFADYLSLYKKIIQES